MGLGLVRSFAVVAALLVLALLAIRRKTTWPALREFFLEPSSPVNIAVLRIVVFFAMFKIALRHEAVWYAGLPRELRVGPFGWGWAAHAPIFEPAWLSVVQPVVVVASACAMLGILTRVSVPVATVLAVYGHAVSTFFGKINHGGHAGTLCAIMLCFAACGDALSVDRSVRWFRHEPLPKPSAAYGLPMRGAWLLLGTSYLFPGFWKLWVSGDLWITGERLRETLRGRWEHLADFAPPAPLDQWPAALALLGTATLVFEIGFIFAVFFRRARIVAALSAVGFHLGIKYFMRITFPPYLPLILLLDFPQIGVLARRVLPAGLERGLDAWLVRAQSAAERIGERIRGSGSPRGYRPRSLLVPAIGALLLVSAQLAAGAFLVASWPISVFPTFMSRSVIAPKVGSDLRIVHESKDGESSDLTEVLSRMGPARLRKLFTRLTDSLADDAIGSATIGLFESNGIRVEPGDSISLYRASWKLDTPGKQDGFKMRLVRSYEVTAGRSLTPVGGAPAKPDRAKQKSKSSKAKAKEKRNAKAKAKHNAKAKRKRKAER